IWINDQNQKVKSNQEFSYSLKDLKIPAETTAVDVNNGYDTSLTAQEAAKLFVNGSKYQLTDKFILDFVDVKTIPTGAELTIKSTTPNYETGELKVVLTTNKYVDSSRYLNNANKDLTYTLKGFNVLEETKAEENIGYDKSLTVQETMKLLENKVFATTDDFILGFVDVKTIPSDAKLTVKTLTPNYSEGKLDVVITTSKHVDSTRYLSDSDKDLAYKFDGFNILAETIAVEANGYDKNLTVQETMEALENQVYELDNDFILGFVNTNTIPTGATLTIKSFEPNYLDGTLEVVITTSKHVDTNRYLSDSDKDLTYTFEGFERTSPTIQKYIDNYDTDHTAQELVEDVLKINKDILGNDKVISAGDLPTHPITQYVDISSFPTNSEFTIQNVRFTAEPAVVSFDIKTDRYYDVKGELKSTGQVIENYTFNMDKIPEQTVVKYNEDVKPFETVQEFEDRIKTSVDQSKFNKDMLKDYLNFETFPSQSEISFVDLKPNYKDGSFEITFNSSIWFDENKVKQTESDSIKSPEFVATVSGLLILDQTIAKENNTYDKKLTVQETMTVLEGKTFEITDDFIQNFVNVESFPMGAKLTIKSFTPDYANGELEVVITTDKFVDENRYLDSETTKDLTYSFEGFKVLAETKSEILNNYDSSKSPQDLITYLDISESQEVSSNSFDKLKEFIDFKTLPTTENNFKLTAKNIEMKNSEGILNFSLETNIWVQEDRYLNRETPLTLNYSFNLEKITQTFITAKNSPIFPTGLQPNNINDYYKNASNEEIVKLLEVSNVPTNANYSIAFEETSQPNVVEATVEISSHFDETGTRLDSPKQFVLNFTLPSIKVQSNIVTKKSVPDSVKKENFLDFIAPMGSDGEREINIDNLSQFIDVSSFPSPSNAPESLKDQIVSETKFTLPSYDLVFTDNQVMFSIVADQIWNEYGFFERVDTTFNLTVTFPSPLPVSFIVLSAALTAGLSGITIFSIVKFIKAGKIKKMI
ncbi:MAG: hypothetical protein ACRC4M_00010, partial [Mycoplasma sp.]